MTAFKINKHALSLNPARFPDETPEQYKIRRDKLKLMSDRRMARVLFHSTKGGDHAINVAKREAREKKKGATK